MQEEFLSPVKILETLGIASDLLACDFGSGIGKWTIPLAKTIPNGMVFAVDIFEENLMFLESEAKRQGVDNIKILLSDIEKGVKINSNEIDLVLVVNLLFQSDRKDLILTEAERILKNEGKLVIIDWKEDNPMGLKKELIVFRDIKDYLAKNFYLEKEFDAGRYHRGLIFVKK